MVLQGWTGHLVTMLHCMLPSWYRSFHRRSFRDYIRFLVFLLAFQTGLRTLMFYYWNYDTFNKHTFQSCINTFEQDYPDSLVFGVYHKSRTRTSDRFFVHFDHHHTHPTDEGFNAALRLKGTTHLKLPVCIIDTLGLGTSYVLKNSVSYEGLWYNVAPVVVLSNAQESGDVDAYLARKWAGFDLSFLRMQSDRVVLFDLLPFTQTFKHHMKQLCLVDKKKKKMECSKRQLMMALRNAAEMLNSTMLLPFRCFVSVLICWAMIFVAMIDVLDLFFAAILVKYIVNWTLFQSLTFTDRPLRDITATLNTRFFFGLALFTSTPLILINSTLPYPIADFLGSSAFLHLLYALYVFRYRVLPAIAVDRGLINIGAAGRNRMGRSRGRGRGRGQGQGQGQDLHGRLGSVDESWEKYHAYQMHVKGLLLIEVDLRQKLQLVARRMEQCAQHLMTQVVHVWSCLNDYTNKEKQVVGGPGFCYGRSLHTGAYVLLGWYDHPTSPTGVAVITRFPGQVVISPSDPCPTSLYQPSTDDLQALQRKLSALRLELTKLSTGDHSTQGSAERGS